MKQFDGYRRGQHLRARAAGLSEGDGIDRDRTRHQAVRCRIAEIQHRAQVANTPASASASAAASATTTDEECSQREIRSLPENARTVHAGIPPMVLRRGRRRAIVRYCGAHHNRGVFATLTVASVVNLGSRVVAEVFFERDIEEQQLAPLLVANAGEVEVS